MAFRTRKNPEVLEKEIDIGKALVDVAISGDAASMAEILADEVSVNADAYNRSLFYKSQNYMTPLQHTTNYGHSKCVALLILNGGEYAINRIILRQHHPTDNPTQ